MSAIEENNRERLLAMGARPASEMTKRERIATEAMASLIAKGWLSEKEESMELIAELAVKMADAMIRKIN